MFGTAELVMLFATLIVFYVYVVAAAMTTVVTLAREPRRNRPPTPTSVRKH